jgi:alkylation response protein AidB-like acyl-CoA dehydrogenase
VNDIAIHDPVTRARGLAAAIADAADEIERSRRFPAALLDRLHEERLFRMLYPGAVGGDEVHPGAYVRAVEEVSRADGSVGWCVSIANSTGLIVPYLDLDVARQIFDPPRATCAWGPPNESQASLCRAATGSLAGGISPAAAAMPAGWARTGRWWSPTDRFGETIWAGRRCAPGCSRSSRPPSSTPGTRSGCAAPRPIPTR